MATTVRLKNVEAVLEGGHWTAEDTELEMILNLWQELWVRSPERDFYTPSHDYTDAHRLADQWGGEVIDHEVDAYDYPADAIF